MKSVVKISTFTSRTLQKNNTKPRKKPLKMATFFRIFTFFHTSLRISTTFLRIFTFFGAKLKHTKIAINSYRIKTYRQNFTDQSYPHHSERAGGKSPLFRAIYPTAQTLRIINNNSSIINQNPPCAFASILIDMTVLPPSKFADNTNSTLKMRLNPR